MCGITGIISNKKDDRAEARLGAMLDTMPYRGPNGRGVYFDDTASLGHLRLAIIDLSPEGAQPMASIDARYLIVFNGEIYNYIEIREELRQIGYRFRTQTDTEVILAAYAEWGSACVSRFNGMWALAIWDAAERRLFASRDRFGVKPFFYRFGGDELIFASEMKAILAAAGGAPKPNSPFLYHYLDRQTPYGSDETVFQGIKTLPPGHNLVWENGALTVARHWEFDRQRFRSQYDFSFPEKTFRELLIDAVKLRLRSDVPVGVCLSGGIDSSVIVSIITKLFGRTIDAFSSVYPDKNYNEEEFIDAVNAEGGTRPHKIYPGPDNFFEALDKLIFHHDEPVRMPSAFSQWHVFRCAQENVVVTLDGQGADELLGGYRYYYPSYLATLLREAMRGKIGNLKLVHEARADLKKYIGTSYDLDTLVRFLPQWVTFLKRSLIPAARWQETVLSPQFIEAHQTKLAPAPRIFPDLFTQHLFETFSTTNLPMILDFEDRISMAFSLEARTPFLDYRLVEFCFGLTHEAKMDGYRNKTILRDAFKDILPEKIFARKDKKGFPTPNERWFRNELRENLHDVFYSKSLEAHGVFDAKKAQALFQRHLAGENHERILWRVIATELWMRKYF